MPDQTMRERVAEEIAAEEEYPHPRGYLRHADAVLAALATPTPAMVEAGAKALFEESQELDQDNSWDDPLPDEWRAAWRAAAEAVITAALTAAFKEGEA